MIKSYICTVKKILFIFSFILAFNSLAQSDTLSWEAKADTVVKYAKSQLGATYKWGTCTPGKCFDCSGLTLYAYKQVGIFCPRSSSGLSNVGDEVALDSCRKGDLILFRGTNPNDKSVGHVGIILENNEEGIKFIHCSSSSRHFGVVITDYYDSGYPKRFIKVKRLF